MIRDRTRAGVLTLPLLWAGVALASPGADAFTSAVDFAGAFPGGVATVDFESFSNGDDLSNASVNASGAASSIGLPPSVADPLGGPALSLRVGRVAENNAASPGANTLGALDPGNFHAFVAGSSLSFSFATPVSGFGLTVITPEEPGLALFDADLRLSAQGAPTAALALSKAVSLGSFEGREYRAFFLGVTASAPFTSATLEPGVGTPSGSFLFQLDDLRVPVPEASSAATTVAGATLLCALSVRRQRSRSST